MLRRRPIQLIRFVNGRTFHSPAFSRRPLLVELEGRPLEHYAVMLQLRMKGVGRPFAWSTTLMGDHDLHRYTGPEKQPAERFAEGTVNEVAPMAIRYLIDHWEAIAEAWKS